MPDFSLNNLSLLLEVDVSGVSLKSAAKSNEKLVNEKYAKCSYLGCPLISSIKKKWFIIFGQNLETLMIVGFTS